MFKGRFSVAFLASFLFFAGSTALGVWVVMQDPAVGEALVEAVGRELFSRLMDDAAWVVAVKLFLNNLQACILLFAGGATFGVLTLAVLGVNGLLIGGVLELVRQQQGLLYVTLAIVPHGIFEVPAFLTAAALGLLLGEHLMNELLGHGDAAAGASGLARTFAGIVIPFLAVAAIIEAFITPQILNLLV
ncbi:MAG: stage II sporulation protein M [Methanomicrobiales archaeon]|nr:stage II sporulation protein M [Methanomicrobiales archaeon]